MSDASGIGAAGTNFSRKLAAIEGRAVPLLHARDMPLYPPTRAPPGMGIWQVSLSNTGTAMTMMAIPANGWEFSL